METKMTKAEILKLIEKSEAKAWRRHLLMSESETLSQDRKDVWSEHWVALWTLKKKIQAS